MTTEKNICNHFLTNIPIFLIVFTLFQGCKVYQDPITLEQAATSNEEEYVKITMLNGDEFIYEELKVIDENYFGIHTQNDEKITSRLIKDEIKIVQKQNKKSSTLLNLLGITIGVASVFLGISMF
jgi:hypothetical protein